MTAIDHFLLQKDLSRSQSRTLFKKLLTRQVERERAKEILVLLQKKGIHSNELTGFIETVQHLEKPIQVKNRFLVDGCGTGGDGKNTFNISTLACLIAAASGAHVAKHGNRGVSSLCGSSDLMESLGVNINAPKNKMLGALRKTGFGYFHAPNYHPIFKHIQPIRSNLAKKKIKTLFNLAGPFLNPLRPKRQLIGVWKKNLVPVMAKTAQNLKLKHVLIVWNQGGFDEMTTHRNILMTEVCGNHITSKTVKPDAFQLRPCKDSDLTGGTAKRNRQIAVSLLSGKDRSGRRDVVLLNAGAILYVSGKTKNIQEGIRLAKQALDFQAASKLLKKIIRMSHDSK